MNPRSSSQSWQSQVSSLGGQCLSLGAPLPLMGIDESLRPWGDKSFLRIGGVKGGFYFESPVDAWS